MILWKNGIFHTMEDPKTVKYLMATDQGRIVGFDDDINPALCDEVIDLNHMHVYPGFVDAHLHLIGYGRMLSRLNLTHVKTKDEMLDKIRDRFQGEPLFVEGYRACGITKDDLNKLSKEVPICLRHNDYHSLTTNDAILSQIGLLDTNGVLTEEDAENAMRAFPHHTKEELISYLQTSIKTLHQLGITGGHSDDLAYYNSYEETRSVFEQVLNDLPFRAHLIVHHTVLDQHIKTDHSLDFSPYLQFGAVKMFYDGTLSSKTALMKTTYTHTHDHGLRIHSIDIFEQMVQKARAHDLAVAIHVIGDQGLYEVCEILKKYPPKHGLHDRIIHAPWADMKTVNLLKTLPVAIDIQPQFLSSDLPWALSFLNEKPDLVFPWKTYLDHKLILCGSSDAPIEHPNPLLGIRAAVYRISDHDGKVYGEEESLSLFDALTLYIKGANYPTYDKQRGYLKKGYIADLTVFNKDLLTLNKDTIKEASVYMTVIDEKIVYQT